LIKNDSEDFIMLHKNPISNKWEKKNVLTKLWSSKTVFNIDNQCFSSSKSISILEWYL